MNLELISQCCSQARSREDLIRSIVDIVSHSSLLEVGVWEGNLSKYLLSCIKDIKSYHLLDAWRCLDDWNKPFNVSTIEFENVYRKMMENLAEFNDKLSIHRMTTLEFVNSDPNVPEFDVLYIDGDHSLRGVLTDILVFEHYLKEGGVMLLDDCGPSIWQHPIDYEPTLVYPVASAYAQSRRYPLYLLPFDQALIIKSPIGHNEYNLTSRKFNHSLSEQIKSMPGLAGRILRLMA